MRTRDEVLRKHGLRVLESGFGKALLRHDHGPTALAEEVERMADRIRELESQQAASEPVAITDAMVEAAARAFYGAFYDGDRLWVRCPDDIRVWWMDAGRDALTAALTRPTTPTRGK